MSYYTYVQEIEEKLVKVLDDEKLTHQLYAGTYPITLTISPRADTGAQMQMFGAGGSVSSPNMSIRLIFKLDGMEIQTDNRLVMTDAVMSKIKGLAKKLHYAYLQAEFAERKALEMPGTSTTTDEEDDVSFDEFLGEPDDDETGY